MANNTNNSFLLSKVQNAVLSNWFIFTDNSRYIQQGYMMVGSSIITPAKQRKVCYGEWLMLYFILYVYSIILTPCIERVLFCTYIYILPMAYIHFKLAHSICLECEMLAVSQKSVCIRFSAPVFFIYMRILVYIHA